MLRVDWDRPLDQSTGDGDGDGYDGSELTKGTSKHLCAKEIAS